MRKLYPFGFFVFLIRFGVFLLFPDREGSAGIHIFLPGQRGNSAAAA